MKNSYLSSFTQKVKALQGKLHNGGGVWRCCDCLKENNYSGAVTPSHTPPQSYTLPCPTEDSRFNKKNS